MPGIAYAQTNEAPPPEAPAAEAGEIIVTGTRATGMQAADSAAPIQLIGSEAISKVGQPNLNQALTQLVPSFQAQNQGTDMASFSLSARLRGISPNHTLVMVNGKRRHGNSILQVINGAFGGSASPSIDLIPPDIVQRIEILQDGAAAQYGSDAIAGVINIILKSDTSGGKVTGSVGQYYDGEGTTYSASTNFGLSIGDSGYLDISLFHRRNEVTTLGEGQITVKNYNGTVNSGTPAGFQSIYNALVSNNGTSHINGGQPKSMLNIGFYNFGYDFGGVELYSFGDVSYRHGDALQGYRVPSRVCTSGSSYKDPITNVALPTDPAYCYGPTVASGMIPHIEVKQQEFQVTNGVKGDLGGFNWDLAVSYSEDLAKVYTTKSLNASMWQNSFFNAYSAARRAGATQTAAAVAGQAGAFSPTDFYDGQFLFTQFTTTLDLRKEIEVGLSDPLTLALGGEYRKETYQIGAGDAGSTYIEGGQAFPGYAKSDAGSIGRTAKAVYADIIVKPVADWSVDLAGRYENYSDFGDTFIGKLTSRYDITDTIAVRGTVSTGFRAPSLPESGYSATSVAPTSATIQLAPSSPGATSAGFGALKPEKSTNFSAGFVVRPMPRMIVTLDGYYIKIKDRIVSSGNITGQNAQPFPTPGTPVLTPLINGLTPYQLVLNAIAASGKQLDPTVLQSGGLSIQTFTNGIDTETWGLEFSARYPITTSFGKFDLTFNANYNKTKVTDNRLGTLFNIQAQAIIEKSSPTFKSVAGINFTKGPFNANLRATYYSKTTSLVQPNAFSTTPRPIGSATNGYYRAVVDPAVIFDLELGYDITKWINLSVGANNLLNKIPEVPPLVADYNAANPAAGWQAGRSPYINGQGSLGAPYTFGPYGTKGGYYYARLALKF
ncbi:MAG: TonB-dependent receptor [Sphingobium sp.]|nr:TonB-dependent receptor [Sphingobium sp.]